MIATSNRQEIVSRFEKWLDGVLTREEPPQGIDAEILSALVSGVPEGEEACDETSSYALWAALTTLSHEVKLQGRAFKELTLALESQHARIGEEIHAAYRDRERDVQRETERRCRKEMLGALIDLHDRLERGLQSAQASAGTSPPKSLFRIFTKRRARPFEAALAALIRGYELSLERLDQTLEDFQVRPIRSLGQLFDPRSMNAIEKETSDEVPAGTVLEVYRAGYEWNGEVFRPAHVKVSVPGTGAK